MFVCGSELTNKSLCMHTRVNICSSVPLMRPEKLCHNENLTSVNQNKQKIKHNTERSSKILNAAQMLKPLKLDRDHSAFFLHYSWRALQLLSSWVADAKLSYHVDTMRYPKKNPNHNLKRNHNQHKPGVSH